MGKKGDAKHMQMHRERFFKLENNKNRRGIKDWLFWDTWHSCREDDRKRLKTKWGF